MKTEPLFSVSALFFTRLDVYPDRLVWNSMFFPATIRRDKIDTIERYFLSSAVEITTVSGRHHYIFPWNPFSNLYSRLSDWELSSQQTENAIKEAPKKFWRSPMGILIMVLFWPISLSVYTWKQERVSKQNRILIILGIIILAGVLSAVL